MTGSRPDPRRGRPSRPVDDVPVGGALAAILAGAAALRFLGLGRQLWLDEIAALTASIRRPILDIATEWPGVASHPLFEMLAHGSSVLLGESPFSLRLPAALFGVAGVWILWEVGRRAADRLTGLLAAGFLAVSYHHVFFSQNARGYTLLLFFYVAAAALLMQPAGRALGRRRGGLYAGAGALAAYSHPFGLFVLPAHLLVVGLEALADTLRGEAVSPRARSVAGWSLAGGALAALLYLPYLGSMLEKLRANVSSPGEGPRLGLGLLTEAYQGLQAALGGVLPLAVAVLVAGVGLWSWVRRRPFALALLVAPLLLEAVVFGALGTGLHPRYFLPALPVACLLGATGLLRLGGPALRRLLPRRERVRRAVAGVLLTGVVLASAVPLARYYRYPKQDYTGAMERARELTRGEARAAGVHLAEHVLNGFYGAGFAPVETLDDLSHLESRSDSLVLVTTLEGLLRTHDEALHRRIHDTYRRVDYLPGTVGDGAMRIYLGPASSGEGPGGGSP